MPETTWKLTLKALGASGARKLTRDVTALTSALNALSGASSSAQATLGRFAPTGTGAQIRGVTGAIRDQTRALREQASVAGRTARAPSARVAPLGGRTRLDVAGAAAGRTRAEFSSADPRALAQGEAFQARARQLRASHQAKVARTAERAAARDARNADRARRREENETARHFRNIFNSAQRNARALERINARSQARMARDRSRAQSRESASRGSQIVSGLGALGSVALGATAALAGVATAFAGIGLSAGRAVIEVAAFRESSLVALEAVLGSSEAAGRQFRNAITVANQTPLDTRDVIAQTQSFAVAGFGEREIAPLIAASADLGAAFGQRSSEGFALALSQIRSAGRLQGQELLQLSNANVSRSAVLDSIARQMNLGEGETGRRAAQQAITQRRVTSAVGEQAALDAVRARLDQGGQLGSFARRQSETLTGALSNARNAVFNLLVGIDFSRIPGIVAFKNALLQITAALSTGSPAAAALRGYITGAANAVGTLFARINPANIGAGITMVTNAFASLGRFGATALPIVRAFGGAFGPAFMAGTAQLRQVFSALTGGGPASANTIRMLTAAATGFGRILGTLVGWTVSTVAGITGLVVIVGGAAAAFAGLVTQAFAALGSLRTIGSVLLASLFGPIASLGTTLNLAFQSVGSNIVNGIIGGIRAGIGSLTTTVTGLGASAVASLRAALGIHSPSRVFADLVGAQIPAGIAMGAMANAGVANDAVAGIVSPRVPQLGGAGASVSIEINVTGAREPQETARAVRAELEDVIGSIFGQWAEATP